MYDYIFAFSYGVIVTYGTHFTYFLHILNTIYAPNQLVKALRLITFSNFGTLKRIFAVFLLHILYFNERKNANL